MRPRGRQNQANGDYRGRREREGHSRVPGKEIQITWFMRLRGGGRRSQTACEEEKGRQKLLRRRDSPERPEELGRSAGEPSRAGRGRSRRTRARSEARG